MKTGTILVVMLSAFVSVCANDLSASVREGHLVSEKEQAELIKKFDKNQNGKIDAAEHRLFSRALSQKEIHARKQWIIAERRKYDLDGNGVLDAGERERRRQSKEVSQTRIVSRVEGVQHAPLSNVANKAEVTSEASKSKGK